ncbi:MAG: leucine-rich repeat domain-containing protein [Verrucomicrobiota bacterium]|nr:leucine-rich repeat domain-containing protein [Verrucomicrobiota bacterium]
MNPAFSSVHGVLLDKNQTTVIEFPEGYEGHYDIPDSVTSIGDETFYSSRSLTSVTIPDSVTSIGDSAFYECSGLTEVYFKGNAPLADRWVFFGAEPTIYYLEGTTGWGETFAGRPTAVWYLEEPEVFLGQMTLDSAGVCFSVVGPAGRTVSVQACTEVATRDWQDLGTYSLDESGEYAFTDPAWADYSSRFYRAVLIE